MLREDDPSQHAVGKVYEHTNGHDHHRPEDHDVDEIAHWANVEVDRRAALTSAKYKPRTGASS